MAAAAAIFGFRALSSPVLSTMSVATAVGENRTVPLPDGSRITVGGYSRVEVSFSDSERRVELARGEALFKVAKDPTRPFVVHAGRARVVATTPLTVTTRWVHEMVYDRVLAIR